MIKTSCKTPYYKLWIDSQQEQALFACHKICGYEKAHNYVKKLNKMKHFWKLHVLDNNSSRALQQDDIKLNNSLLIRHQVDFGVYSSALLNLFAPCHKENTANQRIKDPTVFRRKICRWHMRSPLFPAGRQNISFYQSFQLQFCKQHVTKTIV